MPLQQRRNRENPATAKANPRQRPPARPKTINPPFAGERYVFASASHGRPGETFDMPPYHCGGSVAVRRRFASA